MIEVKKIEVASLIAYKNNARTHSKKQIDQIARSIELFGFNAPILVDSNNQIIAGHARWAAAKQLGIPNVPSIRLNHLTEEQKKAYILADNKLAEKAGWDKKLLKLEFEEFLLLDVDFDLTITGFETPEIDTILHLDTPLDIAEQEVKPELVPKRVNFGDLWRLGDHYLYCGDSLLQESFDTLLGGKKANLVFTDPPYNVPVEGHISGKGKAKHEEFAFASGEMSEAQFIDFLNKIFHNLQACSSDGSIHYICMDWRHIDELIQAGKKVYSELKNVCVWNKQTGGMGSLYRSQHEMIFVFKNGTKGHVNNICLGKYGRNRTNIWDYPGIQASGRLNDLKLHPTCKPISMISDAIIDCSNTGDIVLDCFGGSGSTLLAAEWSKRVAYLIEYEPKYCDVAIYRFEQLTGKKAQKVEPTHE